MNRNFLLAIIGSLLIHIIVLFVVLPKGSKEKKDEQQGKDGKETAASIHAMLKPPEVRIIEQQSKDKGKAKPIFVDDCKSKKYYTGIGIFSAFGAVGEVAPGGPADKAGLRIGDTIMNREILGPDRYPEGTHLTLEIAREGNQRFKVDVTIEKICHTEREFTP